jgi:hypothetical protein
VQARVVINEFVTPGTEQHQVRQAVDVCGGQFRVRPRAAATERHNVSLLREVPWRQGEMMFQEKVIAAGELAPTAGPYEQLNLGESLRATDALNR